MDISKAQVSPRCPIRTTLELISGKWKLLIIAQLAEKPLRLSELKKQIPEISEKMLVQELKNLADSDLVERQSLEAQPTRVAYALTNNGIKIMPLIKEMGKFGTDYNQNLK